MKKLSLLLILTLFACTEDEFTKTTTGSSKQINPVQVSFSEQCTNFTPPPVDILLLTDNSGSVNFLSVDLKNAVNTIINQAKNFFDYRVYVAPLVSHQSETTLQKRSYQILTRSPTYLPTSVRVVGVNELISPQNYNLSGEKGFSRVNDLIRTNSHLSDSCHQYGWNLDEYGEYNGTPLCLDSSCGENGVACSTAGSSDLVVGGETYKSVLVNGDYYRIWKDGVDNSLIGNDYVFRKGAHLLVILMSNGDDNDFGYDNQGNPTIDYFYTRRNELLSTRAEMENPQLRFLSVVNHSQCGTTVRLPGNRYKAMSSQILSTQSIGGSNGVTPDSYDLCLNNITNIFNAISDTIDKFKRGHTYNYWPLGPVLDFDPNKLVVRKKLSGQIIERGNSSNGFTFLPGAQQALNIRETPPVSTLIPAEIYSGYFIQMHGTGKVAYPDCLVVRKEEFTKYFGYFVIEGRKPDPESIEVFLDGQKLPQSSSNGWEYLGWQEGVNLLVKSPSDPSPVFPSDQIFSGYTIKFNGSAIVNNEAGRDLQVRYLPAPFE